MVGGAMVVVFVYGYVRCLVCGYVRYVLICLVAEREEEEEEEEEEGKSDD
jgi:hypothetical protein